MNKGRVDFNRPAPFLSDWRQLTKRSTQKKEHKRIKERVIKVV